MKLNALLPLVLASSALLYACGGGASGSASSASSNPVASNVSGTVTGMASLVIDGVEYSDASATVSKEINPATPAVATAADLQVGQHVEFALSSGVLGAGAIRPRVVGPVESISGSTLKVLGQTVNLVTTASASAPATTFGGSLTGAGSIVVGSVVEVHGTQDASFAITATRIEDEASPVPGYMVVGTIDAQSGTFNTAAFTINGGNLAVTAGSATTVLPSSMSLAGGAVVTVFAPISGYTAGASPAVDTLMAKAIRVHVKQSLIGQTIVEGGRVETLTPASGTPTSFRIDEFTVNLPSSGLTVVSANNALSDIVLGARVVVQGTVQADGTLLASQIWVGASGALLAGPIKSIDTTKKTFVLRHTTVDYSAVTSVAGGTVPASLKAGDFVVVTGKPGATGILATTITLTPVPTGFAAILSDLPPSWNPMLPQNSTLPAGSQRYDGVVNAAPVTSGTTTSFTIVDHKTVTTNVSVGASTTFAPAGKKASDIVKGSALLVIGVPDTTSGTVNASMVFILR